MTLPNFTHTLTTGHSRLDIFFRLTYNDDYAFAENIWKERIHHGKTP